MGTRSARTLSLLLSACTIIALGLGMATPSAQSQTGLRKHLPVRRLKPASRPPGYVPPTVASLRLQPTGANATYWVRATENDYATHTCPTQLTFMVGSAGHQKEVFEYKSCDWLQYLMPGGNGSALITVWETGSAIMTRVFRLFAGHVSLVLERGTHLPPEFTLDGILLNTGWVPVGEQCCTADKTEIWTWTGDRYKLAATVPFDQRYEALAKLEHEAKSK